MEKYLNKEFLMQHKKKIMQIGAVVLILIVAIAIYAAGHSDKNDDIDIAQNNNEAPAAVQNEETEEVIIDICGAVNESKVVTLPLRCLQTVIRYTYLRQMKLSEELSFPPQKVIYPLTTA